jgi:membrane-bound lytic murein transglycosylase MltF
VNIDLTESEHELLAEVLEEKYTRMIQEIDHTDARKFREMLRTKLEVLESLKQKIEQLKR